jgi:polyadenylate-binding protein
MIYSIEDEPSLRSKVDEALVVYQEYVKAQGGQEGEKSAKDDKAEEKA